MPKMKTIDLMIPTYNEEKNIGNLIETIRTQSIFNSIKKIWIILDKSTDKTSEIIESYSKKIRKIKLIKKNERIGKSDSMNRGFKLSNADILIMIDADVHFDDNKALEKLIDPFYKDKSIGLTALKIEPITKKWNIASMASIFSKAIIDELIYHQENFRLDNFYTICGRSTAVIRDVYKKINIKDAPGNDQELFYLTILSNFHTYYIDSSSVKYKVPLSVSDWIKMNIRNRKAIFLKKQLYGEIVNKKMKNTSGKILVFMLAFFKHPLAGLIWFPLYLYGFLKYKKNASNMKGGAWEVSESTK